MITNVKLSKRDRGSASSADPVAEEISDSKFKPNPIPLFVLASLLVHGIGLVLFALIERSQPQVQLVPQTAPIDFVIVPSEESPSQAASDPLPQESTPTDKVIESEAPSQIAATPETHPESLPQEISPPEEIPAETSPPVETPAKISPPPELPSQIAASPEPTPESLPTETKVPEELKTDTFTQPEPITPSVPSNIVEENQNSSEILSGSDPVREETATKTPDITKLKKSPINLDQPENEAVATRLPPKIAPTQPSTTVQPATPPSSPNKTPTTSGTASLLGENLKRSFEDDQGGSFFNLENNYSQQASNPELDFQQKLDMRNYFSEIQRRVRRNWNPNYAAQEYTTVLSFSIQRNGQIDSLQVRRTSGSQEVDREALAAIQNSGPFDPLPANYPSDMLNIQFDFNIYLY